MALYLSNQRVKINSINGQILKLNIPPINYPVIKGIVLKSSDNFILRDINGIYITIKGD